MAKLLGDINNGTGLVAITIPNYLFVNPSKNNNYDYAAVITGALWAPNLKKRRNAKTGVNGTSGVTSVPGQMTHTERKCLPKTVFKEYIYIYNLCVY